MAAPPAQFPFFPIHAPTQIHGYNYPSPFPAPASGYFPTQAFPYAATYAHPPSAQPWVASSPNPGLVPVRFFQPAATAPLRRPDRVPSTHIPCNRSSTPSWLLDAIPTAQNRERRHPQRHASSTSSGKGNDAGGESISDETFVRKHTDGSLSMPNAVPDPSFVTLQGTTASTPSVGFGITSTPAASGASTGPAVLGSTTAAPLVGNTTTSPAATTSPTTTPSAEARVPAEANISKNMPRAILDLKRRLDEQQARDRTSFDKLKGELEKLTSMAAQLATFIGKHTTAAIPGSSPLEVTCTAPIAPKVYDTIPTPSSGYDNFSGHSDQSPAVQDGGTNPREQNLDELPQAYGLHNLNCRTVIRADGTEHSYYALPGDYPLERATPEPLFSKESVDVLASLQEQHTHEDQQTYGSIEYNHSNNEIELPSVTNSEPCTELGKAQVHNHEWNMLLTEKREEWDPGIRKTLMDISQVAKLSSFTLVSSPLSMLWDPGASLPLISIKARQLDQTLQTSIHASTLVDKLHGQENVAPLAGSSVTGFNRYTCLSFWVQYKFYVLWKSEIGMTTCISWDPGIQHYMAPNGIISVHQDNSFIMLRAAHFSECKYPYSLYCKCMLKTEYCPSRCLSEISVSCLKRLQWNPGDFTHMLLVLCVSCREITDNCFADLKLMANTSSKLAALTWHSSLSGTPFLLLSSTTYTWEPGVQCIIDRLLDKFIESNQVQSVQQIRYHAASVWDSSTILLGYKSKWWLLFTEEKTNWHKDINRYGIALWLITFNPP